MARDTRLMVEALRVLGTQIDETADAWQVFPRQLSGPGSIDCGLAGTVMRFVPPVSALAAGRIDFDGDAAARQRPLGPMLAALRTLGVAVQPSTDRLPFWLDAAGAVRGGSVSLDASASSQFVSGLLLSGARFDTGLDVRSDGKPVPSLPHIEMTVAMLRQRGIIVDDSEPSRWRVLPGEIAPLSFEVEPDLSNAAPFLAAAVVTGGEVTIAGWPAQTTQPGDRLRDIFEQFGAGVRRDAAGLTVTGPQRIGAVDLDLHEVGELTPVIAAVAAVACGPSYLRGIAHLRGHETDRLAALAGELTRLGCQVTAGSDTLHIRPRRLTGATLQTYADHRIAQAAAVLGLVVPGVRIVDVATTAKTHPGFVESWLALLR